MTDTGESPRPCPRCGLLPTECKQLSDREWVRVQKEAALAREAKKRARWPEHNDGPTDG